MPSNSTFDDLDSDPNEPELNFNLYKGLVGKGVNEEVIDLDPVPQRRNSTERQNSANLGSRKGKKRLPLSLDASFDVDIASASSYTQSKDKEGPSTTRKGREGTGRKDKERATLRRSKQSRESDTKEQVRKHLKWEKKRKRNPSLDLSYILKQLDKLKRSFMRSMLVASLLLIILKKKCPRCQRLRMGMLLSLSSQMWMLPIVVLWFPGT